MWKTNDTKMKNNRGFWLQLFPILSGFFVMGFVDVVGIATNYVKQDFHLSDTLSNLLPMMVFLWFAVCSVPSGLLMSRIGRRNTVLLSLGITLVAMLLPLVSYGFAWLLVAFALLGIGNTVLQVSLNPMVAAIVTGDRMASVLTLGQFVKAVSSFLGPVIAGAAASCFGDWNLIFGAYAVVTLLSAVWMWASIGPDRPAAERPASFSSTLSLFADRNIRWLFVGILAVVGLDVGLNTGIPKLLMARTDLALNEAGLGTSLYFISRTAGTFLGTFLLARIPRDRFLGVSLSFALLAFAGLLVARELWLLSLLIVLVGLCCSNVFSILFSYALEQRPQQADEVSALMIMGVSGGVVVMPFMGLLSDAWGAVAGMLPLLLCLLYLLGVSRKAGKFGPQPPKA